VKNRLLVDAIPLLSSLTGIGRYTYEIAKRVELFKQLECSYFYGYYSHKLIHPSSGKDIKTFKSLIAKSTILKKIARKVLMLSSKLFAPTYDLYWQPNFIPLENIKAKKVVTSVHDFSFILHSEHHPKERIEYFEKNFFKNIYKSHMIITGSEFSKQEILDRLDFKEDQVKVIYHGIDHELFKVYDNPHVDFNLPKKFIFSVGSIEPRKNLLGLLKAYNQLSPKIKNEYKLVLAGFKGWENQEIMKLIERDQEYIHYLGFISDDELVKVYNLASLFLFPSFYEGFGLPVLEAMACGTPVVCSDSSSLPEVGRDAVTYCDPYSVKDIQDKIELVLKDEHLQEQMITKGLGRVKGFSWEKSAKEHIRVFEEVLSS